MTEARIALIISGLSFLISGGGLAVNYWGTSTNVRVQNMLNRPSITPKGVKVTFCKPGIGPECPEVPFEQADDMTLMEVYENTGNIQADNDVTGLN